MPGNGSQRVDDPERIAVELVPPSDDWTRLAAEESARLGTALGSLLVAVHHIGSTAIPGIMAKPIIDLLPIVQSVEKLEARGPALRSLGYRWHGEFGLAGRRYCTRNDPKTGKRAVQCHFYAEGDPSIARHLSFRDYLVAHPAAAREYEAVKCRAAAQHSGDVFDYNDAKDAWIKTTEASALAWSRKRDAGC